MTRFWVVVLAVACASCRNAPQQAASTPAETEPPARIDEVVLDGVKQQKAGIAIEAVRGEAAAATIQAAGQLAMNEDRTWRVGAFSSGRVVDVLARPGDRVRKGQVLARLSSEDVHEIRAAYRRAQEEIRRLRAVEAQALRVRERAQRLFALKAASREQVEAAETEYRNARAAVQNAITDAEKERVHLTDILGVRAEPGGDLQDYIPVLAPASGLVMERKAGQGSVVSTGDVMFTITDPSSLWMIAAVNESDLGQLHIGQHANVYVRAWPDVAFPGRILRLGEQLDAVTRTLQVRIAVPNASDRLKPEMYATAEIESAARRRGVFIPQSAIQEVNGHKVVFVNTARNRFAVRAIEPGHAKGGELEVLAGLKPDERIVTKGSFVLKSQLLARTLAEE